MKKCLALALALIMTLCFCSASLAEEKTAFKIGICNFVDDASLNQIIANIRAQLAVIEAEKGVTGYMVEKQLKETLGFSPDGDIFAPGTLPQTEGKAKRVFYQKDGVDVPKL